MTFTAADIDKIIDQQYLGRTDSGELRQLAVLFSQPFWDQLKNLMTRSYKPIKGIKREVDVGIGYIDKIPLAEFTSKTCDIHNQEITERTEIGDAAVFFVDKFVYPNGTERVDSALGLILQAKQATSVKLPKRVPVVPLPLDANESTLKELALLSKWPEFDLYFGSNSDEALQKGYIINNGSGLVQPQGWYIGAPPDMSKQWSIPNKSHWIAGPSINAASCDHTLGDLLHSLFLNSGNLAGTNGVGAAFDFDPSQLDNPDGDDILTPKSVPPDWSDLCHQLMLACNRYDLPESLFSGGKRGVGTKIYSGPFFPLPEFVVKYASKLTRKIASFFSSTSADSSERRFHVAVVVIVRREY